jgi:hypothetical protein
MEETKIKIGDVVRHRYLSGRHRLSVINVGESKLLVRYVLQGGKIETLELFMHEVELFMEEKVETTFGW